MRSQLLPVNEVFSTLQGEGKYTGTPSTFIRLQMCPVGCPWCDTKYSWSFDLENERSRSEVFAKTAATNETFALTTVEQLLPEVKERHVVITGGEPGQYDLRELTEALIQSRHTTQLETSGTFDLRVDTRTWVTVSPKVNMPGGLSVKPSALRRANEIKHVVGKRSDVKVLKSLLADTNPMALIYLQPLSCSRKATDLCIEIAGKEGWKVSIQTHRFIDVR